MTFLAELPDKSTFAALVLATRYRPAWVWVGVSAAFTTQMAIAVTAGQLFTLLPHHIVDWLAAGLFVAGAAFLWFAGFRSPKPDEADAARQGSLPSSFLRVAASFAVIFLAEWGDITQLAAAHLATRYNPALVSAGATVGLCAVAAFAAVAG